MALDKERLSALLKQYKLGPHSPQHGIPSPPTTSATIQLSTPSIDSSTSLTTGINKSTGEVITYNQKQQEFISLVCEGKSCVLIGPAGSGKTTCQRGSLESLVSSGSVSPMKNVIHKHLISDTPGIVIVSFTRRAVSNIRKAVSEDLKRNCLTIHALLEYEPVYTEVFDNATGEYKKTMSFEPTRTSMNPLPSDIQVCVVEESSMVSVELFKELQDALPSDCQFIFLGDIQQLPPVFGSAILGYKMLELPVIELTEIYRQALESPIIRLAHRILSGKSIPHTEYPEWKHEGKLTIHPWKKRIDPENALLTIAAFLKQGIDHKLYNPDEDMVLIPFNKSCGTIELNKHIAQYMARKRGATVYEIISGFSKIYLSVGDKILYDKEDAEVVDIQLNPDYTGATPQPAHKMLDYWGYNESSGDSATHHSIDDSNGMDELDFMLSQSMSSSSGEESKRQGSHIVKIKLLETGNIIEVKSAGDLNALLLSFVLTVHKSQGSEFRKVFLMLHQSHATMLSRELLYTAVTRAKEELYIICEPESFTSGIKSQRIKGNTLAEKAEFFKGKLTSGMGGM